MPEEDNENNEIQQQLKDSIKVHAKNISEERAAKRAAAARTSILPIPSDRGDEG